MWAFEIILFHLYLKNKRKNQQLYHYAFGKTFSISLEELSNKGGR